MTVAVVDMVLIASPEPRTLRHPLHMHTPAFTRHGVGRRRYHSTDLLLKQYIYNTIRKILITKFCLSLPPPFSIGVLTLRANTLTRVGGP